MEGDIARLTHACTHTLTLTLALAQIYNVQQGKYIFKDKYYGRNLNQKGFFTALRDFLYNGLVYRVDILPQLLKMLCELRETIRNQASFRYYSSSLLLIYDGDTSALNNDKHEGETDNVGMAPLLPKFPPNWTESGCWPNRAAPVPWHVRPDLDAIRGNVDVRMIDFAHTTHKGFKEDPVCYQGPDEGYILGLTTLINAFESMLKNDLSSPSSS